MSKDKKGKKTKVGIYHPPKSGMPYLVVTISPEGVTATAVESKDEARVLASKKVQTVTIEAATAKSSAIQRLEKDQAG